jgi:curved DNA-binding protein CbpA
MALLLRWLHPDKDKAGERSRFTARVTLAWDDLKTPERRAAYDKTRESVQQRQQPGASRRRHAAPGFRAAYGPPQAGMRPAHVPGREPAGLIARTLRLLFRKKG